MNPVRPCGVSDCGSSLPDAVCALGSRTSLTMSSSSPRQTPIAPQTLCVHSPAGTTSPLSSRPPIAAPTMITAMTPTAARIQGSGPRTSRPYFAGSDISSRKTTSSLQKRSTVGMLTRSSGECGNSICGPNESMSRPGTFVPITAVSSPA